MARATGANASELAQAGWFIALHLWFLPVYLLLIASTPLLLAAHQRWGLRVPAAMAVAAAAVDLAVVSSHLPLVGFANYPLVWGSMHQWGFAWHDGSLTRGRRPLRMAMASAVLLAGLLFWGPFPVDMVGTGRPVGNTTPPSIALLAFAAAQCSLLLAAEPAGRRLLASAKRQGRLARLNQAVMTVYLWHPVPVVVVAATLYPAEVAPQPSIGTWQWWALRPVWCAVLSVLLIPLTMAAQRAQRPPHGPAAGPGPGGRWSPVVLALGLAAILPALARLAIDGFAPAGHPAGPVLALYVCGFLLVQLAGRRRPALPRRFDGARVHDRRELMTGTDVPRRHSRRILKDSGPTGDRALPGLGPTYRVGLPVAGRTPSEVTMGNASTLGSAGPVVVGTDGSEPARRAVLFALREAQLRGVGVRAVCAYGSGHTGQADLGTPAWPRTVGELPTHLHDIVAREVTDSVEELRRQVGEPFVEVEVHCDRGRPAHVLLEASQDASLLVVGTRGAGLWGRLALGSTSTEVVHHAHVPVVVVPPGPEATTR
ncbi:universal stress protein [Kitasatospora aureofaciens]|uniref:universal stress protein n=1 Tax=Kitasatospora aureofaciens TaxID=1894 RepID=UPI00382CF00A